MKAYEKVEVKLRLKQYKDVAVETMTAYGEVEVKLHFSTQPQLRDMQHTEQQTC